MDEVPEGKCGYTWPEDYEVDADPKHQSCCWRDTFQNENLCVWHTDPDEVGEKYIEALRESRVDLGLISQIQWNIELLDGAVLTGIEFGDNFSVVRYSLRDADLSRSDLSNADLSHADLSNADLSHADLSNAELFRTDLTGAMLRQTDLTDAGLYGANLSDSMLGGADLINSYLDKADLTDANLIHTDLTDATLHDADLAGTSLIAVDLRDADLTDASLGGTNLENTDLVDAGLRNADLTDANLRDADLTDADIRNANLTDADIRNANLTDADLTDTSLRWALLTDVAAIRTNFTDTNLLGADFEGASLKDAQFDGANLVGARLYDTKPQGMSINDQTVFSQQTVYEREADPCDPWHPLDGEPTTPTSVQDKTALAVRSSQILQSRFRSADASPPSGSIAKIRQAITQFRRHRNLDTEDRREVGARLKKATSVYRIRQRLQRENSRPRDVAQPYVREQHSRRKRAFVTRSYWEWFKHATYRWVMLYGESPARVIGTSIAVVAVFAAIYSIVGGILIGGETPGHIGNIYFSAVTFSTLGYGGIEPTTTTTQLLASVQSLIGGILIALLVAVFGRRALR